MEIGAFKENGYHIIKNAIHPHALMLMAVEFQILKNSEYYYKNKQADEYHGDKLTEKCFHAYAPLCFESLMLILREDFEKIVERPLLSTFSYARAYFKNSVLPTHTDGPRSEYAATVCIESTGGVWPLYIDTTKHGVVSIELNPGDICIYNGITQPHWRDPCPNDLQVQAFLSYVDAEGPYKHHVFDQRPMLGLPYEIVTRKNGFL